VSPATGKSQGRYLSALRFRALTRVYDPAIRWTTREATFKRRLLEQAAPAADSRVLDLGCGTGTLAIMLKRTQPDAAVIGLDADRGEAVLDLACGPGPNFSLLEEDGDRTVGQAVALDYSPKMLSAARERVRRGRFVVLDGGTFRGPARVLNPVIKPLLGYASNWDAESDLVAELEDAFAELVVEDFNGGSLFIAVARKPGVESERTGR